jgi:hypothetical protein
MHYCAMCACTEHTVLSLSWTFPDGCLCATSSGKWKLCLWCDGIVACTTLGAWCSYHELFVMWHFWTFQHIKKTTFHRAVWQFTLHITIQSQCMKTRNQQILYDLHTISPCLQWHKCAYGNYLISSAHSCTLLVYMSYYSMWIWCSS